MACRSLMGFQSCSTNTTVSAPVRFRPRPPTWVVSSSTSMDGSLLNLRFKEKKVREKNWTHNNRQHYSRWSSEPKLPYESFH